MGGGTVCQIYQCEIRVLKGCTMLRSVVHEQRRRTRNMLIHMISKFLYLVNLYFRLYTPFGALVDADSENFTREAIQAVIVEDLCRCPPSTMWWLTGETPDSFVSMVALLRQLGCVAATERGCCREEEEARA